jgi:hypothetical protein
MIKSNVYSLSRTEMAQLASEEYVRSYWFIIVPVPIFGVLAVLFGHDALQVLGMLAVVWPLSIPARSVLSTTKSSRLFAGGCHVEADEEAVTFIGEYNDGKRLRYALKTFQIKDVVIRRDLMLIRLRLPGIAPIRVNAFETDAEAQAFMAFVNQAVAKRVASAVQ